MQTRLGFLTIALIVWWTYASATFLDFIPPADPDGNNGSGSLGSPAGFNPLLGPAGFLFDVHRDFSITAVSVAMAVEGAVQMSAAIRNASGTVVAEATQVVTNSPDWFRPTDRINPSDSHEWFWFDLPLPFHFTAGNRYQFILPFYDFVFVAGRFTRDANNWLLIVPHFFDNEYSALTEPYAVQGVLTVVDGTLKGSRITGMPLAGMVTTLTDIPDIDRTFPQSVPEPATMTLLGSGLASLGLVFMRQHRRCSQGKSRHR